MDRIIEPSPETTIELQHLRRQVGQLERRVAQLEARGRYAGPPHAVGRPMDELPDRVRAIVCEQSVILMATTFLSAIAVFIIVRLAT